MRVLFCHGAWQDPRGRFSQALAAAGHDVIAPDYRGLDLATAADIITYQILDQSQPLVVVGHSFGGAVGLLAVIRAATAGGTTAGLLLCAPALFLAEAVAGPERLRCPVRVILIHGTRDEAIPIALSRGFAREHDAQLIEVDDGHALSRSHSVVLDAIAALRQ
jgi:pimeloyl-ACP methyl ester carboxylesterase